MKIIKEFWEFQKSFYGHMKSVHDAEEELIDYVDDADISHGIHAILKNGEEISVDELKNGKYYGKDSYGNEISGDITDIQN